MNAIINDKPSFGMTTLFLIILLEGFVTISVEILTIRQLIPFVGNNVIVTSLIIGVFLLFLALGYRRGGMYRAGYRRILKANFIKASLLIGVGLSYFFITNFFHIFTTHVSNHLLLALMFYLLLVTSPIVYILGQTVPITTNLYKREATVGAVSGKVLYISTIGSFLGAVLTSLLLFTYTGVAWTVFINFVLLATLIVLLFTSFAKDMFDLTLLLVGLIIAFGLNVMLEHSFFIKTNNYANYRVVKNFEITPNNAGTILVANNSVASFINKQKQGAPYIELIKRVLFKDLKLRGKNILVLGAGGFTLSAENKFGNKFTYVDIDRAIKNIAEIHFAGDIQGDFVAADARSYIKNKQALYDVIVSDAYKHHITIPAYLLTTQHLKNLRTALKPGGIAIFNLIANPLLNDDFSKRADNTIHAVFPNCAMMPLHYRNQPTNIIYICKKSPQEKDSMIYTDDMNRATVDYFFGEL